ncbi:MAG: glycoside hydrolase family 31 protein [Candidatus Sumerlaeia bacterium]|nr:glycoside hydrolase family 31 protein [Candidatus Sumerlaeia bacterium]
MLNPLSPRAPQLLAFLAAAAALPSGAGAHSSEPIVHQNARFTVITPELVRMEYSESGEFVDEPSIFAVNRSEFFGGASIRKTPESLEIKTERFRLLYTPNGKPFSAQNLKVWIETGSTEVIWTPDSQQQDNLGGTLATLDQIKGPVHLGEGLLSRQGWYLLDDSKGFLLTNDWVEPRPATAGSDQYLFAYGTDYEAAFQSFITISGAAPMPRKVVLGSWYSRWWHYTTEDYKGIVQEYAEHNFPLDIIVMDMEWHTGDWTGWSWNYELLPDPPALLEWFREQQLTVTLNVHPSDGVRPTESMYEEFMATLGEDSSTSKTVTFDAGNKKYMEAYFQHTHHPREAEGVDFWWLDWQQYPEVKSVPGLLNLTWLNKLYFDNSLRTGKRGLQFSRWGGWGDHRNPIHFSGDADTGWAMLGFEVVFTSTAGNVGCYYWSHDIGGHFGERNEEPYTRWVQFAATTAAMRLHSGIIEYLDRRPWKWADWATESMRHSFHLRAKLLPYIYSATWETHRTGLPLNRPMYVAYPTESDAYQAPQEYLFGSDLLVAPIASPGYGPGRVSSQLVWFPEGQWSNFFTGETYEGPQWRLVSADMNEFPFYVRAGVPVPMQPYHQRPTSQPLSTLELELFPGPDGEEFGFSLYEDDGDSRGYETGAYATTYLSSVREYNTTRLTVYPTDGTYEGQVKERATVVRLRNLKHPASVSLNGSPIRHEWNAETHTVTVSVPMTSIDQEWTLECVAEEADRAALQQQNTLRLLKQIAGESATDLQAELKRAAETNGDTLPGLLALAGVRVVENETHYPEPGVLRRIVRNEDSPISTDGLTLTWKREFTGLTPRPMISTFAEFQNLNGTTDYTPPAWTNDPLPFLESQRDTLEFTCQLGSTTLRTTRALGEQHGILHQWYVSPWYPFDTKGSIVTHKGAPEQLSVSALRAINGDTEGWTLAQPNQNGLVDLLAVHKGDNRFAYATTTFTLDAETPAVLGFRSDDGIQVWLNGSLIHTADVLRGINHDWEEIPVTFAAGENTLLLKVSQAEMGWEFMVRGRLK